MIIADRVDLPFVKDTGVETGRVGLVLPAGTPPVCPPIGPPFFRDRKVDPFFAGWQVLAEFSATDWRAQTPIFNSASASGTILRRHGQPDGDRVVVTMASDGNSAKFETVTGPVAGPPQPSDWEFDRLVRAYVDERPDAMGEIVAQNSEFLTYFMDLLSFGPSSHPATTKVMQAASLIGLFCCQYWKNKYRRVRPAQLFPGLLPPVATPGHAAFPSGHATQAHLVYKCLWSLLPAAGIGGTANSPYTIAAPALERLARRIARNREIAGLHYPSDSVAGRHLANKIFNNILLKAVDGVGMPLVFAVDMPIYRRLVVKAQQEWT